MQATALITNIFFDKGCNHAYYHYIRITRILLHNVSDAWRQYLSQSCYQPIPHCYHNMFNEENHTVHPACLLWQVLPVETGDSDLDADGVAGFFHVASGGLPVLLLRLSTRIQLRAHLQYHVCEGTPHLLLLWLCSTQFLQPGWVELTRSQGLKKYCTNYTN